MDLEIPLNRLKFGQDDGDGINARVVGREEDIAPLAANLHANGQIENLIVKPCGDDFYSVANGNRRLAAFRMIYGEQSSHPVKCTVHDVDEAKGFEFSLTTAITPSSCIRSINTRPSRGSRNAGRRMRRSPSSTA
jgi:ParB family chromosome partitioning protein